MTEIKSNKPNSPHDEFYRQALTNIKVAAELFDNFLPKYVRELIDISTLKPSKDTFYDLSILLKVMLQLRAFIWLQISQ